MVHESVSCADLPPLRDGDFDHSTALLGHGGDRHELDLQDVVVAFVAQDLLGWLFTVSLAVTSNCQVCLGDSARLDSDSGNSDLTLVLLALEVVVVADFNGLEDLTRPGSEEVGEHHVHHLDGLHARRNFCEPELQDPEIAFLDSTVNLHLLICTAG